jgi:hypothetical protein
MKQSIQLLVVALIFLTLGIFIAKLLFPNTEQTPDPCAGSEEFMPFLQHFHDDVRFQQERTSFPLLYVTSSQEMENRLDSFLIERSTWVPLHVFDSAGTVVQVFATPHNPDEPDVCGMTVTLDGIHHGQNVIFKFILRNNEWYLSAFEDYSF